jgi:hypothetical protein
MWDILGIAMSFAVLGNQLPMAWCVRVHFSSVGICHCFSESSDVFFVMTGGASQACLLPHQEHSRRVVFSMVCVLGQYWYRLDVAVVLVVAGQLLVCFLQISLRRVL